MRIVSSGENVLNHFAPSVHFRKLKYEDKPLYLGVELEMPCVDGVKYGDEIPIFYNYLKDFCILKYEGCVGNNGAEIVSLPCSLQYHIKAWKEFFTDLQEKTLLEAPPSCGLHVHINRDGILLDVQGRMTVFYNTRENASFLTEIAGRVVNETGCYNLMRPKTVKGFASMIERANEKGQAVSISSRNMNKTLEVRIFKSTKNYSLFIHRLEFVQALVEFCTFANSDKFQFSTFFVDWFYHKYMDQEYPTLGRFLTEMGLFKGFKERAI